MVGELVLRIIKALFRINGSDMDTFWCILVFALYATDSLRTCISKTYDVKSNEMQKRTSQYIIGNKYYVAWL